MPFRNRGSRRDISEAEAVRSVSPTSSVHSYIPSSDSISNLSSKVKDCMSGPMGYIAGGNPESGPSQSPSVGDLSQVAEGGEEVIPTPLEEPELPSFTKVSALTLSDLGLPNPMRVYTAGNLCHPYLDILTAKYSRICY